MLQGGEGGENSSMCSKADLKGASVWSINPEGWSHLKKEKVTGLVGLCPKSSGGAPQEGAGAPGSSVGQKPQSIKPSN